MELIILAVPVLIGLAIVLAVVGAAKKKQRNAPPAPAGYYSPTPAPAPSAPSGDQSTDLFSGIFTGAPQVTVKVGPWTPPYEAVVSGAHVRGYVMVAETLDTPDGSATTLVFTRR